MSSAATGTVCSGAAQNYTITSATAGTTFSWSRAAVTGITNAAVTGQTSATITEALVNTTNAPIAVAYSIVPTANGCPGAAFTYTVTVNPTADVSSAATGTACSGAAQNLMLTSSVAGATFSWSRAAVAGISNAAVTNQSGSTITEALVNTTTAPIAVIYTITPSFGGCAGTPATYTVTVNPTATITSATGTTICSGASFSYAMTSSVAGATYSWSRAAVAGISNAAVSGQTSNPISETLTNTTNAAINVTYVITPVATGCNGTPFNYVVSVNPVPAITSVTTATLCSEAAFSYAITSNVSGVAYTWNRPAVAGISNAAAVNQPTPIINEILVNTTDNPVVVTYTITAASSTCNGAPFTLTVTVNPKPRVSFTIAQGSDCVNLPVAFTSNVSPNVGSYSWNFGDGTPRSTDANPSHQYANGGQFNVTLTVATAAGCTTGTAPQTVTLSPLLPRPVVQVTATPSSLLFYWNAVPNATGYEISLDGGATFITPNDTSHLRHLLDGLQPLQSFTIIVRVLGATPCQANTATLSATVPLPDVGIFVPNTISPNGDGRNETLKVMGNNIAQYSLKVFSQWGQLLYAYDGKDGSKGWDGTVGGALQPAGVYAYAVSVTLTNGQVITKKGLFNLLR